MGKRKTPENAAKGSRVTEVSAMTLDSGDDAEVRVPSELAILPNAHYVLYPSMIAPLVVSGEAHLAMIDEVMRGDRMIGIFAAREESEGEESEDERRADEAGDDGLSSEAQGDPSDDVKGGFERIYEIGTAALILKLLKVPDGSVRLLVHGVSRVRVQAKLASEPYLRAEVEALRSEAEEGKEIEAMKKNAVSLLTAFGEAASLPEDVVMGATNVSDPGKLADLIASNLRIKLGEQQVILEIIDPKLRLLKVQEILTRELEFARIGSRIQSQIRSKMDKHQRDFFLREQMKAIRAELGEGEEGAGDTEELRAEIEKARLPAAVSKIALKELTRLESIPMASPEYTVSRTYLGWIVALPWRKKTRGRIDLKKARKILDEDHFDLDKVKERIIEYLAVIKLRKSLKGPILCFVGPPGVGKTSLGRSIARAMGRKFARISLGGMHDEAEIRGHRRTYIGAMPGRIINAIKECGTINPVVMLDEIDKVGSDFRGDPSSALLEVLDPEQNFSFTDHYMDLPYDLSRVMFITTANILDTIPSALLDRMEVLRLSGYTLREKIAIARQYLIRRALENSGLEKGAVRFTEEGLETLIERYTREAGLRNLEREINNVCRKVARRVAEGRKGRVVADSEHVEQALGPWRFSLEDAARARTPGVAVGLAWTAAGGDILFIEATATPGEGKLTLTGQLGDVMKESARAALTYLQAHGRELGIGVSKFTKRNFHIHVPAGATPKDGPSAGVAMMAALASLLEGRALRSKLAMTGEITIKGTVLPVGGIKEKVLAAHRSGIVRVILPKDNERDLADVPEEIKKAMVFRFVSTGAEALGYALPAKSAPRKRKRAAPRASRAASAPKKRVRKKASRR